MSKSQSPLINKSLDSEEAQLEHFQKKAILSEIITKLSEEDDSTYYLPTVQIAAIIEEIIRHKEFLSHQQWEVVKNLSKDDIHILISHKE